MLDLRTFPDGDRILINPKCIAAAKTSRERNEAGGYQSVVTILLACGEQEKVCDDDRKVLDAVWEAMEEGSSVVGG